jgi:hypothetical protein
MGGAHRSKTRKYQSQTVRPSDKLIPDNLLSASGGRRPVGLRAVCLCAQSGTPSGRAFFPNTRSGFCQICSWLNCSALCPNPLRAKVIPWKQTAHYREPFCLTYSSAMLPPRARLFPISAARVLAHCHQRLTAWPRSPGSRAAPSSGAARHLLPEGEGSKMPECLLPPGEGARRADEGAALPAATWLDGLELPQGWIATPDRPKIDDQKSC